MRKRAILKTWDHPARPGFGFVIVDYEIISQNTKANTANGGKAVHSTFHIAS
jgi:hypothetical protein